jgi:putative DNA methylase
MSGTPVSGDYIKTEGKAGRMGVRLMAIVAEGERGRLYLAPTPEHEAAAQQAKPTWRPEGEIATRMTGGNCTPYGLTSWGDLFTPRQLVALTTFSDLVQEARERVQRDALAASFDSPTQPSPAGGGLSGSSPWRGEVGRGDDIPLRDGGTGTTAYAEAVGVYLAFCVDKMTDTNTCLCSWQVDPPRLRATFGRQALPMVWDYAEANIFGDAAGDFGRCVGSLTEVLDKGSLAGSGTAHQSDAQTLAVNRPRVFSTDPPYYDNIGYADLSDFFYVWLRRSLRPVFPDLFVTLAVPKAEELVATPYRHGSKEKAETFFLDGMTQAMHRLAEQAHQAFPVTIYYAFKQSESQTDTGTASTGWETFLDAVIRAGFGISGTWPMRSELATRNVGRDTNALASSIVLVCRQRPADAPTVSRREYLRELNAVLPEALDEMTKGSGDDRSPVAPVDLSQAIIGPGMAVFSKYTAVLEADGTPMSVHTALQLINRFLAEDDFDPDTQFCLHWFEQHGWGAGRFGDADTLSRAKGTSVDGMRDAGVVESGGGIVRLRKWSEYPTDWDPQTDTRNPVWETLHHLIRALKQDGETSAGRLLATVKGKAEATRQLAYRLYTLCERQGWAEDARAYNELITSWTGIEAAAGAAPTAEQGNLFA